jgi:hypothetical protein
VFLHRWLNLRNAGRSAMREELEGLLTSFNGKADEVVHVT